MPAEASAEEVNAIFAPLAEQARQQLLSEGFPEDRIALNWSVDLRYRRQVHEVTTPIRAATPLDQAGLETLIADFEALYERKFGKGSAYREAGVEMTMFRLTASGKIERPNLPKVAEGAADAGAAKIGRRPVFSERHGALVEADIYDFTRLEPGNRLAGPAVIHTPITTIAVQADQTARMDGYRNIVLELEG